jgi:FolB domain-containing protein
MASDDKILIRDLRARAIVGINDWEREQPQEVIVQLTLFGDLAPAGATDDIADTVNYRSLAKAVIAHIEASRHYLVEALAGAIARLCVVEHGVPRVVVRVEKPGALRFAASVGVEIERRREDFTG